MAVTEESRLVWQKALRKLHEATATPVETFPGIVVVSSYFAMRHAAVAVLLNDGPVPSAETAIVAKFGEKMGTDGYAHGQAFNRVFDLRNTEDYDAVTAPTVDEAKTARDDATALIDYCDKRFKFSASDGQAQAEP